MDYSNDIKFSNNLIKNGETYITYSGNLYKQNSTSVHIVYGFGDNWEHTIEKEMEKNLNGFVAKIKLLNYDKFNFCFKNQYNEWDNNNNSNYTTPIIEDNNYENNFIINEDLLYDLLANVFSSNNDSSYSTTKSLESDSENNSNTTSSVINTQIAEIFSNNESDSTNTTTNDIIVNPNEEIQITDVEVTPLEFQTDTAISDEPINNENIDLNQNISSEIDVNDAEAFSQEDFNNAEEISQEDADDVEVISQEHTNNEESNIISQENCSNTNSEANNSNEFDMNSLIDEILSPIVTSEDFVEEDLESYKKISGLESMDNLDDNEYKEEDKKLDDVINHYLDDLYNNISTTDNTISNENEKNDLSNNYSDLDKTISKFKQIQALQDLESFFDSNINENVRKINQSTDESIENTISSNEKAQTTNESLDETEEQSLIEDAVNNNSNEIVNENSDYKNNETALIVSPRHLSPLYIVKKKLKISFLKIFKFIPRLLNKKINEQ